MSRRFSKDAQGSVPSFADLRGIREALGLSQSEMAELLGLSVRAVQSYEQGWRSSQPCTQKLAMLLLYLSRRREGGVTPCWQLKDCPPDVREACPAHRLKEGEVCWVASGGACNAGATLAWDEKAALCQECPVFRARFVGECAPA